MEKEEAVWKKPGKDEDAPHPDVFGPQKGSSLQLRDPRGTNAFAHSQGVMGEGSSPGDSGTESVEGTLVTFHAESTRVQIAWKQRKAHQSEKEWRLFRHGLEVAKRKEGRVQTRRIGVPWKRSRSWGAIRGLLKKYFGDLDVIPGCNLFDPPTSASQQSSYMGNDSGFRNIVGCPCEDEALGSPWDGLKATTVLVAQWG